MGRTDVAKHQYSVLLLYLFKRKISRTNYKPVWLSQRFPCRLFILKIMMCFAAGVDVHHAVFNFGEVLFNLFVDVFGNGVGFDER